MSLRGVVNRKLFNHSCCNKGVGTIQPQYVIYKRSLERCFIHRTPLLLSSHAGFRLLSISLNKFNILSRLTSFFTQKLKKDETSNAPPEKLKNDTFSNDLPEKLKKDTFSNAPPEKLKNDTSSNNPPAKLKNDMFSNTPPVKLKNDTFSNDPLEKLKNDMFSNDPPEKLQNDVSSNDPPVNHAQDQTQADESSRSLMHKPVWMSVLDKLSVSSPYNISTPVSTVLKENLTAESDMKKRLHIHKKILEPTETFLQQYNKDLDLILKKTDPSKLVRKSKQKLQKSDKSKAGNKTDINKSIKYPKVKASTSSAVKTPRFDETRQFLQSLGIPCDELEYYPSIQEMDKDTILTCVKMLKEMGIHVVFSLFLIYRVSLELNLEDRESSSKKPQAKKLPLTSFEQVRTYLELCQLLETPDLDIRKLLERIAEFEYYPDMLVLNRRVKKLRAVGASPNDILSNLEILRGCEIFDEKIELYQASPQIGRGPFPVHLFLARKMDIFKEKLGIGDEIMEVVKLLDVSLVDFQACWGFRCNQHKLQYKVQMCLSAGISKKDIFNNLGILMAFPLKDCYAVTSSFRDSGLPASMLVLREMANAAKVNGNGNNNICDSGNDQKCVDTDSHGLPEEDWVGETKSLCQDNSKVLPSKNQAVSLRNCELSSRKQRRLLFNLIQNLLHLDSAMSSAMYECNVNVNMVRMQDVPKNLDFLVSLNYTREDIAKCPFILAHPHNDLVRVVREAESLVLKQVQSASPESSFHFMKFQDLKAKDQDIFRNTLHDSQCQRLNTFQYLLEKEISFSMGSSDSERHFEFLNI